MSVGSRVAGSTVILSANVGCNNPRQSSKVQKLQTRCGSTGGAAARTWRAWLDLVRGLRIASHLDYYASSALVTLSILGCSLRWSDSHARHIVKSSIRAVLLSRVEWCGRGRESQVEATVPRSRSRRPRPLPLNARVALISTSASCTLAMSATSGVVTPIKAHNGDEAASGTKRKRSESPQMQSPDVGKMAAVEGSKSATNARHDQSLFRDILDILQR